ncbi:cupin domain-containing protein [Clostridiaceae bacterium OM02-2AC]|nr:cupin domain-containing protein [Clostridiaceae bacterium OM02-2AC]
MKSEIEHYENQSGGKGTMHIERLLQSEEMGSSVKMYARVTIDVNSSLGVHQHIGDGESYYILQGRALYDDNGIKRELRPGDVTFTPDQGFHGIENIGDEPLVFMALIIKA